jgi:methionyl-tRNA formyltransferase
MNNMNQFDQLNIRIIFLATPSFALPSLKKFIGNPDYQIVGVITQPDKPAGRKLELKSSPVKLEAQKQNLPHFEPANKKGLTEIIKQLKPDFGIVVAYGKIIPQDVLDLLPNKILNLHPSILPKYRGASPIQSVILNGEKQTGTTIMLLDADMDHGPILAQETFELDDKITATELHDFLSQHGADLLEKTFAEYLNGKIKPQPQNHTLATFCKLLTKEDGLIDWNKSAEKITAQVRALNPWPGTYTKFQNKTVKIVEVRANGRSPLQNNPVGVLFSENKKLTVNCGENSGIIIEQIQPEGKKVMSGEEFVRGYLK